MLQLKAGVWGFDDFLRNGLVEYLDVNEEDNALIALYEENIGAPDIYRLQSITLQVHPKPVGCLLQKGIAVPTPAEPACNAVCSLIPTL